MAKELKFDEHARRALESGVNQLADAEVGDRFPFRREHSPIVGVGAVVGLRKGDPWHGVHPDRQCV